MNMDLDINPADLQFFDGFGLDVIISDQPDLDLIILLKFFHNVWFSFKITVFNLCNDITCYNVIDLCELFKFGSGSMKIRRHWELCNTHIVLVQMFSRPDDQEH